MQAWSRVKAPCGTWVLCYRASKCPTAVDLPPFNKALSSPGPHQLSSNYCCMPPATSIKSWPPSYLLYPVAYIFVTEDSQLPGSNIYPMTSPQVSKVLSWQVKTILPCRTSSSLVTQMHGQHPPKIPWAVMFCPHLYPYMMPSTSHASPQNCSHMCHLLIPNPSGNSDTLEHRTQGYCVLSGWALVGFRQSPSDVLCSLWSQRLSSWS